jgi:hypothetical protein
VEYAAKPLRSASSRAADLLLQILNLARQCGLCLAQPLSRSPVVLFFADRQEVSQVSQFHIDTLQALVQS